MMHSAQWWAARCAMAVLGGLMESVGLLKIVEQLPHDAAEQDDGEEEDRDDGAADESGWQVGGCVHAGI